MKVDLYKAEANRLATHLAEIHGIKLKHASILEAVAALHGARNWSTLIAENELGLLKRLTRGVSPRRSLLGAVADCEGLLFPSVASQLCLGYTLEGARPLSIADGLLCQHMLVLGEAGSGARTMLKHLMVQQIIRGGGLLVMDGISDPHISHMLATAVTRAGRAGDYRKILIDQAQRSDGYDALGGTNVARLTEQVLQCLPPPASPQASFPFQMARAILGAVISALIELKEDVSFDRLTELFSEPEQLRALMHELSTDLTAYLQLRVLLEPFMVQTSDGPMLNVLEFQKQFGGLGAGLLRLSQGGVGQVLRTAKNRFSVQELVRQEQVAYVSLQDSTGRGAPLAHMLKNDLFAALPAQGSPRHAASVPFMVVVSNISELIDEAWRFAFHQARACGVALVFHADNLESLRRASSPVAEVVLANTATKFIFRQSPGKHLSEAVRLVGTQAAQGGTGSPDFGSVHRRLSGLTVGQALMLADSRLQDLRTCRVDFSVRAAPDDGRASQTNEAGGAAPRPLLDLPST